MERGIKADISIVGAGVTGLMLTNKLTDLGYKVALIDKQPFAAGGPSTKNEGWLHKGTYHATSIANEDHAIRVAKRCMYGHSEIRRMAPEAIEDIDKPTFTVVSGQNAAESAVQRWEQAGVEYKPVELNKFRSLNPDVNTDTVTNSFEVGDVSINSRLLYQKLLAQSQKGGAEVFLGSNFHPVDTENADLVQEGGDKISIRSDMFIVTAGYGIGEIYNQVTREDLSIRYWKSHLLVFPRLTENNVFSINPGDAALFNHRSTSVVGQHEDALLTETANFDVVHERAQRVFDATRQLFPNADEHKDSYMPVACLKPDVAQTTTQARSLDITVFEPADNYIFALPGKMTEAPFVTDQIVQTVFDKGLDSINQVAKRPCDIYTQFSIT